MSRIAKLILLLCPALLCTQLLLAQTRSFSAEYPFLQYLLGQQLYAERLSLLNQYRHTALNPGQRDSLHYHLGLTFHHLGQSDSAAHYFAAVDTGAALRPEASFFLACHLSALQQYPQAEAVMQQMQDTKLSEYKYIYLSGLALLRRDLPAFEKYQSPLSHQVPVLRPVAQNLQEQAQLLRGLRKKSPLLAGMFSAVVPGMGRVYAGKPGQAMGSLMPVVLLGLQTLEAYRQGGIKNPRFWVFGGLFGTFYIGNIWGSALSAKIKRHETLEEIHRQVYYELSVSLHRVF